MSCICRVSPKSFVSSNGGNNSHKSHMSSTSASSNSSTSSSSSSTTGLSNNRNRINGLKSLVQQDSKLIKSPSTDAAGTNGSTPVAAAANGDVGSEGGKQLSGGNHKVHLTSTKRQSVVKTAPKVDQSATTTISELEHKIHKVKCFLCSLYFYDYVSRLLARPFLLTDYIDSWNLEQDRGML